MSEADFYNPMLGEAHMTDEQLRECGRRARKGIPKLAPEFADWAVFSRTLGWFQWKKQHNLTPEQIEHFCQGFCET